MADYLTSTLLNFSKFSIKMEDIESLGALENYQLNDYTSMKFNELRIFIDTLPATMFDWYQLQNNVAIEKVALDLYGNADYWDILLLVNARSPLIEMPYDFDTISAIVEDKIAKYITDVYGTSLPDDVYQSMYTAYEEKLNTSVEEWRVIKIVKPERIQEFLQRGYEQGLFV